MVVVHQLPSRPLAVAADKFTRDLPVEKSNVEGPAIGIDLGTTYSCVGIWQNDRVEIIANDQGNRTTPSFVAFTDSERMIGDAAKNQAAMNPTNTVFDAKRLIGRRFSESATQSDIKHFPFKVFAKDGDRPCIQVEYKGETKVHFPPPDLATATQAPRTAPDTYPTLAGRTSSRRRSPPWSS